MAFLIAFICVVLIFRPLNRFVRGNGDILDDRNFLLRHFFIAFFLFSTSLSLAFFYEYFSKRREDLFEAAVTFFVVGLIMGLLLFAIRRLYHKHYEENEKSFRYRGLFREKSLAFQDIAKVRFYKNYKGGGTGYQLIDKNGERYNLQSGFFNMFYLKEYIKQNASKVPEESVFQWIELKNNRTALQAYAAKDALDLWVKIQSRVRSYFSLTFPPRMQEKEGGVEQRPHRIFIFFSVLFFLLALLIIFFLFQTVILKNNTIGLKIFHALAILLVIFASFLLAFILLMQYKKSFYFENAQKIVLGKGDYKSELFYSQMESVTIKGQKILFYEASHDIRPSTPLIFRTRTFIPKELINHLSTHFDLIRTEKDGTFYLRKKEL